MTHDQLVQQGMTNSVVMGVNNRISGREIINTGSMGTGTQSCTPGEGTGGQLNPQIGCMTQAPNVVAGETGPTQISFWNAGDQQDGPPYLDAKVPDADPTAMGDFVSGIEDIRPGWVGYAPNKAHPVSWGSGPQSLAGSPVWNCGDGDSQLQVGGQAQHSETTNITGTVSVAQGVNLLDAVNTTITASLSVGHAWTTTTTDTQQVNETSSPRRSAG